MAILRIGGRDIEVPPLNFKAIKRIWPLMEGVTTSKDFMKLIDTATEILEIALARSETPLKAAEIEDQLLGFELEGVQKSVEDLLVESGLLKRVTGGEEAVGEPPAKPSMGTGTDSSRNSPPPVSAPETGTE
jgi:hypothetical protein